MTPLDDVLDLVRIGYTSIGKALRILENLPEQSNETHELRVAVGTCAALLSEWERERDRWR